MKIAIEKNALTAALSKAMRAVAAKTTAPILEGVLLKAEDRSLNITGNNAEIAIQATANCEVLRPGGCVVNAKLFSEIVQTMPPHEEIDITLNQLELTIEAGNNISKIKALETSGFPSIRPTEAKGGQVVEIGQEELKSLITKTVFATSLDETRAPYMGLLISIKNGVMDVVATDTFRLAIRSTEVESEDFEAIIHGKTMSDLVKILGSGSIRIYKNGNSVMFEAEGYFLMARTIDGTFIDYKRLLIAGETSAVTVNTMEIRKAVEAVLPFVPSTEACKNPPVKMSIDDKSGKITVSYFSNIGETTNDVPAEVEGESCVLAFNPKYVVDALKVIEDDKVKLCYSGELNPIFVKPVDGEAFVYMLLPVRTR